MPTTMLSETGPIDKIESTTSWLELVCVGRLWELFVVISWSSVAKPRSDCTSSES